MAAERATSTTPTPPASAPSVPKDDECAAKLKKRTLTNLYNAPHLARPGPRKLDAAVAAYG